MNKEELLKAPIVVGAEAAGTKLGAKATAVQELWGEPDSVKSIDDQQKQWAYGPVAFWISDSQVSRIAVYQGYEGQMAEGIGIGSTRLDVERALGPLIGNERWHPMISPNGIGFDMHGEPGQEPLVTGIYID